jgi:hypothetical protein
MRKHQLTETDAAELSEIDADAPLAECLESAGETPSTERSRQLRDRFGLLSPEDLGDLIGVNTRTLAWWRARKQAQTTSAPEEQSTTDAPMLRPGSPSM